MKLENEKEVLKEIKKNPCVIQRVDNPSIEAQLEAVSISPLVIHLLINPPEEVIQTVMKRDPWCIGYSQEPPENFQLIALENRWNNGFYINYIKDLPNKTEWFHREFNRLKLIKGPLK